MAPFFVLVAAAALGIEAGWEPLPQGGHEYTIQIEPQLLDLLKKGDEEISSEIPPQVNVRRFRITVGRGKLTRDAGPAQANATPVEPPLPETEPNKSFVKSAPDDEPGDDLVDLPSRTKQGDDALETDASESDSPARLPGAETTLAGHHESGIIDTEKPKLSTQDESAEAKPWLAFSTALVLLCGSLGANVYLGWIAWDARNRYRAALSKVRPAAGA